MSYRPLNCRPVRRPAVCCSGDCNQDRTCLQPGAAGTALRLPALAIALVLACYWVSALVYVLR